MLAASREALAGVIADHRLPPFIQAVRAAQLHSLRAEVSRAPVLTSSDVLIRYLSAVLAHESRECLRVLFLNAANRLLSDEQMAQGTVNGAIIYPREILRRALELSATALILVHNHPSGDPCPSRSDIESTRKLARTAAALDITLHDHLIIASSGWSSLRAIGAI